MVMEQGGKGPGRVPSLGQSAEPPPHPAGPALGLPHTCPCCAPMSGGASPRPQVLPLTLSSLQQSRGWRPLPGALPLPPLLPPPQCQDPSCLCMGAAGDSHVGWEFGLPCFHLGAEGHGALAGGTCCLPGCGDRGLWGGCSRHGAAGLSQRS